MAQTIFTHLLNSSRERFLSKHVRDRREKTFYDGQKEDDWEAIGQWHFLQKQTVSVGSAYSDVSHVS